MSDKSSSSAKFAELKSRSQMLEPILRVGKAGVSDAFVSQVKDAFAHHDLIKIKFEGHKDEKKILAPFIAEKTGSQLILRVGNTATYYRALFAKK